MFTLDGFLESITLKDAIYFLGGIIAVISIIIERTKSLPFQPWTHLFKWIGKNITGGLEAKLDELERKQCANTEAIVELEKKMEKRFEEQKQDSDEKEAQRLRANIISFADSCRCGNKHTQTHYENVMRDYDKYKDYCTKHGIPNHYIDSDYRYIDELYHERLRKNDFL